MLFLSFVFIFFVSLPFHYISFLSVHQFGKGGIKAQHQQDLDALREEHKEETAHLREELEQAKKSLEKREIALNEAGSIAVAALQLNGVFEAAQAASQQYIENIRSLSDRQAAICAQRDVENRVEVERKLKEAEEMENKSFNSLGAA